MPHSASFCNSCGADLSAAPTPGLAGAVSPEEFESAVRNGRTQAAGEVPAPHAAAFAPPFPAPATRPTFYARPQAPYAYPYRRAPYIRSTTDNLAIASIVCAFASFVLLPLLPAVAAIVTGYVSRERIRASEGRLGGSGLALAGILAGAGNLVLCALLMAVIIAVYFS